MSIRITNSILRCRYRHSVRHESFARVCLLWRFCFARLGDTVKKSCSRRRSHPLIKAVRAAPVGKHRDEKCCFLILPPIFLAFDFTELTCLLVFRALLPAFVLLFVAVEVSPHSHVTETTIRKNLVEQDTATIHTVTTTFFRNDWFHRPSPQSHIVCTICVYLGASASNPPIILYPETHE